MMLGLLTSLVSSNATAVAIGRPPESIPADAFQEPEAEGDDAYWSKRNDGYYQEPEP